MLYPPERITFRHLQGPLTSSDKEFLLDEVEDGTALSYQGEIECKLRWMPGIGWLAALLYVRPKYNAVIRAHTKRLKAGAEARAARSHVFRRAQRT